MERIDNKHTMLLSVKPQYANLLVDGIKTIELRRKFPEDLSPDSRCLIYASSPIQAVIGECWIKRVERLSLSDLWRRTSVDSMISWSAFRDYFDGQDYGFAVSVYRQQRYEKPKALKEISSAAPARPPQSFCYLANASI